VWTEYPAIAGFGEAKLKDKNPSEKVKVVKDYSWEGAA